MPPLDQFSASGAVERFPLHPQQVVDVVAVPAARRALRRSRKSAVMLLTLLFRSWGGGKPARALAWLGTWVKGTDEACAQEVILLVGNYTS